MLGTTELTIRHHLRDLGLNFSAKFSNFSDAELDALVVNLVKDFPSCGYRQIRGLLEAQGHYLQETRVLASLRRVDSVGLNIRKLNLKVIHRRNYSVCSPQALWHIDSHHKLIR